MQSRGKWLPILASVGIGAATYYTMRKNNQSLSQTITNMIPFVSGMRSSGGKSGKLGPFGMA